MREFDVVVLGAGPAGEVTAGRLGKHGRLGRADRAGARRRGVLVLRVHAVEGPAPADRPGARGAAASRASRSAPIDVAAVLARRDEVEPQPRRLGPAPVAREERRDAVRGHGRSTASAASWSETRRSSPAGRSWSRRGRGPPFRTSPGCATRGRGRIERRPRRARSPAGWRSSAGASSASRWHRPGRPRLAGDARPSRRPAARPQGAVRGRAGARRAARKAGVDVRLQTDGHARLALGHDRCSSSTTDPASRPTSCWSRPGARPGPGASGSPSWASTRTRRSRWATTCACPDTTGCTPWATSTGGCCSRTWASTRAGWSRTRSSAARSACARTAHDRRR